MAAKFGTLAIHAGQSPDQWKCKAVMPPITTSTTYKQQEPGQPVQYAYIADGNSTRNVLESKLAALEGADYAFVTNSGSTATTLIFQAILQPGDELLTSDDVYYGSNTLFKKVATNFGVTTSFVDVLDINSLEAAINDSTKMVWLDCPSNPLLNMVDIKKTADIVHSKNCFLIIDSTFSTPYFQRPLLFGADIVMHSATKFINGHGDVLMGIICTSNTGIADKLNQLQTTVGAVPSPFDCYLANRGIRTLHVRMKQHAHNAMKIAQYLESSPLVEQTIYPGLPSHPQYDIVNKQCTGFGGMVSFKILGTLENAKKFMTSLKIFQPAVSLGGLESLAEICTIMTRKDMSAEDKAKIGITENLIRLSVGLEDEQDLINDLSQALKASHEI